MRCILHLILAEMLDAKSFSKSVGAEGCAENFEVECLFTLLDGLPVYPAMVIV